MSAVLGDNTRFSVGSSLSKNGTLPIFCSLYAGGSGAVIGKLQFVTKPGTSDAEGILHWLKPLSARDNRFALGFASSPSVVGARYVAPRKGAFALAGLNTTSGHASVTFSEGNLSPFSKAVTVSHQNTVTVDLPSTDKLQLSINARYGTISGSFFAPSEQSATTFSGVLLQQGNRAVGLFFGPSQSGTIELVPAN